MNYREFRSRYRMIPFGKFSSSGRGRSPFNQIFVGRINERASIIEALTHQEKFGALLVSGRRGSGKTSFVDYVLDEYRRSAFHRFIRFSRRNGLADLAAGIGSAVFLALFLAIFTQTQELLTINAAYAMGDGGPRSRYLWVFLALLAYPLMIAALLAYALRGYGAVSMMARRGTVSATWGILLGFLVTLAAIDIMLLNNVFWTALSNVSNELLAFFDQQPKPARNAASSPADRLPIAVAILVMVLAGFLAVVAVGAAAYGIIRKLVRTYQKHGWRGLIKAALKVLLLPLFAWPAYTIALRYYDGVHNATILATLASGLIIAAIFYGFRAFRKTDTKKSRNKPVHQQLVRLRYLLFVFALVFAFPWTNAGDHNAILPSSSEPPGLGEFILAIFATLAALVIAQAFVSCIPVPKSASQPSSPNLSIAWAWSRSYRHWAALLELLIFAAVLVVFLPQGSGPVPDDMPILALQFATALAVLACTDVLRISPKRKLKEQISKSMQLSLLFAALSITTIWVFVWFGSEPQQRWNLHWIAVVAIAAFAALAIKVVLVHIRHSSLGQEEWSDPRSEAGKWRDFIFYNRTPIEITLVIKSVMFVGIAVALAAPFVNLVSDELHAIDYTIGGYGVIAFAALLMLIFCIEYSWISRGMRSERQDQPIVPLGRDPNEAQVERLWPMSEEWPANRKPTEDQKKPGDPSLQPDWWDGRASNPLQAGRDSVGTMSARRREIARAVEAASLPNLFYGTRVPVIVSRINLGFDDLRHSRIVEAMLVQLRDRYKEQFIAVSSRVGFGTLLITLALMIGLTRLVADNFFEIPAPHTMAKVQNGLADSVGTQPGLLEILSGTPERSSPPGELVLRTPQGTSSAQYDYCGFFRNLPASQRPLANGAICLLPWSNAVYDAIYTPVLVLQRPPEEFQALNGNYAEMSGDKASITPSSLIFQLFFDLNVDLPVPASVLAETPLEQTQAPTLRIYHILVFVLLAITVQRLNRTLKLRPYTYRIAQMDRLIELLRGRVTRSSSDTPRIGWFQWALGLRQRDERIETSPDPRVVEQSFIDLLLSINPDNRGERAFLSNWFEIRPELVFVFDEMDKLSGKIDPETSRTDEVAAAVEENTRERQRAMQLHQLLSDMKRLLSSNSARFVFIGSRLYHDEWLADQVDRTPLLTSIFSEQVYLPSLLTDREHSYGRFNDRIGEYFVLMYRNAVDRLGHWKLKRQGLPFVGSFGLSEPTYVQGNLPHSGHPRRTAMMAHYVGLRVYDEDGQFYGSEARKLPTARNNARRSGDPYDLTRGEMETIEQFINFLTYRSAGNPKKMKEILQSMVKPSSKAFDLPRYGKEHQRKVRFGMQSPHHDCITMDDKSLYRIQFIDLLYRHLTEHLESRMLERDDKVAMSVFYLMDFLLKFHNRGFSWTNLQRVDELSHIHRAPDLRSMMGVLVDASSERFLHRVLNGVYAFRFRSDFGREIDYLSRISKEEMAALNFTLDESQDLKGLYQATIRRGEHENVDTIAGLGELYEYDQDYEIARNYYRRAMVVLDNSYMNAVATEFDTGPGENPEPISEATLSQTPRGFGGTYTSFSDDGTKFRPLGVILQDPHSPESKRAINSNFSWAIARVRLLLQIGHTYEQERNYERALASYMHAHRLSQAVLLAVPAQDPADPDENELMSERVITPQNYSILYQAAMAAAWIFEKGNQDADDSIAHAERAILWLYERNPALRLQNLEELRKRPGTLRRATFSIRLFASDMHDRLGDLYFYKGKQSTRMIDNWETYQTADRYSHASLRFGYLIRAHHHYAMSIWNIRNYLGFRTRSSTARLNMLEHGSGWEERTTIKFDGTFPDLVHNNLANSFTDMSEAILARSSMGELLRSFRSMGKSSGNWSVTELREEAARYRSELTQCVSRFIRNLPQTPDVNLDKSEGLTGYDLFDLPKSGKQPTPVRLIDRKLRGSDAITWLGDGKNWPTKDTDYSLRSSLVFSTITTQDERLNAATFFSSVAAKNFAIAGYNIDAANEYLLQAQTYIGLLWTMRQLEWMSNNAPSTTQEYIRQMLFPAGLRDRLRTFSKGVGSQKMIKIKYLVAVNSMLAKKQSDLELSREWITFLTTPDEIKAPPLRDRVVPGKVYVGPTQPPVSLRRSGNERNRFLSEDWREFCATAEASPADYSSFNAWRETHNGTDDPAGTAKLQLGIMAHVSLLRAMSAIQTSHRTSATRFAQNHGDPSAFERDLMKEFREFLIKVLLNSTPSNHAPTIYKLAKPNSDPLNSALSDKNLRAKSFTRQNIEDMLDRLLDDRKYDALNKDRQPVAHKHITDYIGFITRLDELKKQKPATAKSSRKDIDYHREELESDYQLSQPWRDEPRLATLGAQLVLALGDMNEANSDSDTSRLAAMIYDDFLGVNGAGRYTKRDQTEIDNPAGLSEDRMRETYNALHRQTETFRFPVLNRLRALRVLSDAAVIHGSGIMERPEWVKAAPDNVNGPFDFGVKNTWGDGDVKSREHAGLVGRLCRELSHTAEIYDSENHFSPHLQGTSLAMAYFFCLKGGRRVLYDTATGDAWDDERVAEFAKPGHERNWRNKPTLSAAVITREAMGEMAVNMLRRSEQMYSMGKAYYENISSLQYLNDDFNDRITHYNQATRMMYSELIGTMIAAVHDDIFKE